MGHFIFSLIGLKRILCTNIFEKALKTPPSLRFSSTVFGLGYPGFGIFVPLCRSGAHFCAKAAKQIEELQTALEAAKAGMFGPGFSPGSVLQGIRV